MRTLSGRAWQRRHAVLTILFAGYFLLYMDRMAIAAAIPFMAKEFGLSALGMGSVLSSFLWAMP